LLHIVIVSFLLGHTGDSFYNCEIDIKRQNTLLEASV
jgi:hypothetical protein